jgi:hypothetical protein
MLPSPHFAHPHFAELPKMVAFLGEKATISGKSTTSAL